MVSLIPLSVQTTFLIVFPLPNNVVATWALSCLLWPKTCFFPQGSKTQWRDLNLLTSTNTDQQHCLPEVAQWRKESWFQKRDMNTSTQAFPLTPNYFVINSGPFQDHLPGRKIKSCTWNQSEPQTLTNGLWWGLLTVSKGLDPNQSEVGNTEHCNLGEYEAHLNRHVLTGMRSY